MRVATIHDGRDIANYVCGVGAAWIVGGVARLLEPGCQMDYTLVLCGAEGQGKSTALKVLGHNWFTDSIKDIREEALIQLQGIWIVEFSELEAWRRGDWKGLRAFLTSRDDKFRDKYGHFSESHPRRCIFAGTTNDEWFLESGSEGRRFWPVRCTEPIRIKDLERDAEQLWAEGKERWLGGARPHLSDASIADAASQERIAFKQDDPWLVEVQKYLDLRADNEDNPVTVNEILKHGIKQETNRMTRVDQSRVIAILKGLGYESCQFGPSDKRTRGWRLAFVEVPG
jgi:predicted P-loop ATPase